jgi:hypothetical protein
MIRIAFDMNHLRGDVFGFVPERMNDDSAAHRTIGTGGARLSGFRNLEFLRLRVGSTNVEAKSRGDNCAGGRPYKRPSRYNSRECLQRLDLVNLH